MESGAIAASDIEAVAGRYGEAWNSQDLALIVSLHTDDSVFQLHAGGAEVRGREALEATFGGFLAQFPDIHFEPRRLRTGADHWVLESTMSGTLARPLELDGAVAEPGRRVSVDAVDVIAVEDGLVARKDTYLDAVEMQRQLGISP